jgi:hypothetical protein
LLVSHSDVDAHGFRLRGREVSRVEALSDAVFGFAITLLVVSLEVPQTFDQLMTNMSGFFSFGCTFTMLLMIWYLHYQFFRRYGLQDFTTIVLNALLLFVVVFYIYPLKFMFTLLFGVMLGLGGGAVSLSRDEDNVTLMVLYSLSVVAVFGLFALMHAHAWRQRVALRLDPLEEHLTRTSLWYCLIWVGVGLLSISLAWFGGLRMVALAGLSYALLGPLQAWNGIRGAKSAPQRPASPSNDQSQLPA